MGPSHEFFITSSDLYLPIHFHVYEDGLMGFPDETLLYNSINYVEGTISGFDDTLTVSYAELHLLPTGQSDSGEAAGEYDLDNIHIMTGGEIYADYEVEYKITLGSK